MDVRAAGALGRTIADEAVVVVSATLGRNFTFVHRVDGTVFGTTSMGLKILRSRRDEVW